MRLFLLLLQLASVAKANTEKTIFVAPSSISLPNVQPGLDNLCLDVLSPNNSSLHVQLSVAFPNEESPRGIQSWYLLDRLQSGQRYELRVCWVATVSTHFIRTYHRPTSILSYIPTPPSETTTWLPKMLTTTASNLRSSGWILILLPKHLKRQTLFKAFPNTPKDEIARLAIDTLQLTPPFQASKPLCYS
jgi:hypothetical protein